MEVWHYLVIILLAAIAYRLYKIQDIVSGRAKKRQEERDEWLKQNTSPLKESLLEAAMSLGIAFGTFTVLALGFWLYLRK